MLAVVPHDDGVRPERVEVAAQRVRVAFAAELREWGVALEPATINGQPGFRAIAPDGRLVSVAGLDVVDGRVARVWSIVNPDKLGHLGPVSDLALRPSASPS